MKEYPAAFVSKVRARTKEYRFVIGFILDVDSIYVTSHDDIASVPGTVINSALAEPVITSQRLRPDDARAEIGTASFSVIDIAEQFTDEVRERLEDGVGLRGVRVRFYCGFAGDAFTDLQLVGTQRVASISYADGRYNIECADIQRSIKSDIFDVVSTTLAATLTAGDTVIQLTDATAFERVYHGDSYSDAPNSTVGYVKIKNTIYRYTGKSSNQLTGCTPVFGTTAETITIDPALAADRRERVEEYIYIELPAVKLALAILTGDLYNDGVTLPDHWTLSIATEWITEDDFTNIGADIWNPATDASPNAGRVLRFEGLKRTDAKAFLEKEIYLATGLFSPVYADGSLGLRRMTRIAEDASHIAVLDNSNSIEVGALSHSMKLLHNVFRVNWSWNGSRFNRANEYIDVASVSIHGAADVYERSFKGLHGSIHTDGAVFAMLDMLRDRYAAPPQEITAKVLDSLNALEVGDVVRCRWRHVRDFAGRAPGANDPGIDRAFEVQSVRCDFRTGVTLELFGSTARAEAHSPTTPTSSLPNDFYDSQGTALASAAGITIVDGVITAASAPLVGHADLTNGAAIYYHTGNLTLAAGVTLTITNNVQLRVRGFFTVNGTISGIGTGHAGVVDDGRALSYTYTKADYEADRVATQMIPGTPGFVGASRGYDGVLRIADIFSTFHLLATREAAFTASQYPVAPVVSLQVSGTTLLGLPTDLRGTGGAPGGRAGSDTGTITPGSARLGGSGANGGAGLAIVCRGMARGANGLIDLSGANSSAPSMVTLFDIDMFPGAGGAGGPGTCYIFLDGSNLSAPDLGLGFRAYTGSIPATTGNALAARGQNGYATSGNYTGPNPAQEPVAGYADPRIISGMNLSGAALRVQYVPASETPVEDTDTRPPPLTNLTAAGVVGGISVSTEAPPPEQWDTIEYYAAATNDRSGATLANRSRSTSFVLPFATATTRYFWARTRANAITSDWFPSSATGGVGGTSVEGGGGTPGESIEAQFATTDSGPWHSTFATGDLYMRTRVGAGGAWQGPWRIVGEAGTPGATGADGNYIAFIFRRSATQPATPTGNNPSGWSDAPTAYDGNPLWMARATKTPAGILVGTWSTPAVLALDGEDGAPGIPGVQGPGLFSWANAVNVTTTPSTIVKTAGGNGFNAGAHSIESYSAGCFFSARAGQSTTAKVLGFNDDPAADATASGINFGWIWNTDGSCRIIQNGSQGASQGTYTTDTVLSGIHDGETVRFYKDGVQVSTEIPYTGRLFLDASLFTVGASLVDVHFGPNGSRGPAGQSLRLASTAQAFTFASGGVTPSPAGQSITFTATRSNIATATVWSTTPAGVTLGGSGDTRTLAVADFGSNSSVRVTASAGGFTDSITVVRLSQGATGSTGQAAMAGYLTNESHTLPADPDGVVSPGDLAGAVGFFRYFEGVVDRSAAATYSVTNVSNCTAQVNTADNTPVAGQPRGFYRVTAITADAAFVDILGSYGGVDITRRFSITRARAGRAGDGQNLLPVDDWVIGTQGHQGPSNRWFRNGNDNENVIVLGGAGTAPLGPFGTSEILWECRVISGGGTDGDGGWNVNADIDHTRTYRSTVWFRINQSSGNYYHGCAGGNTYDLGGGANGNPYFLAVNLPGAQNEIRPNKWYLSVGIIHGSGYTGGNSGIAGIYDPETGRRVLAGTEYRNAPGATAQTHRVYHFYDANTSTRQWMPKPRFEEINGGEATIDALLGFHRSIPWIARGNCQASGRTLMKAGGASEWGVDDIYSAVGYSSAHLQFKAAQTNRYFMIGFSNAPAANSNYTNLTHAWYPAADGNAYIYESGSQITAGTPYSTATHFKINRDIDGTVRYYKDDTLWRTTTYTGVLVYADSAFHTPLAAANNVIFGPGIEFENINTNDIAPEAATTIVSATLADGSFFYGTVSGSLNETRTALTCVYTNTTTSTVQVDAAYKVLASVQGTELSGFSRWVWARIRVDGVEVYAESNQGGYFSDRVSPNGLPRSGSLPITVAAGSQIRMDINIQARTAVSGVYPNIPDARFRDSSITLTAVKR